MIDFNEELKKFKPVLEVEKLQDEVGNTEIKDMLELLLQLLQKAEKE